MNTYIQFKDDIAFAFVMTESEIENGFKLDESINPESVLNKKYINKKWQDAPVIYYVESVSDKGYLTSINSTIFPSEVKGEIVSSSVTTGSKKINDEWINIDQLKESTRPKETPSWIWDGDILQWVCPIPKPQGDNWIWNEQSFQWVNNS